MYRGRRHAGYVDLRTPVYARPATFGSLSVMNLLRIVRIEHGEDRGQSTLSALTGSGHETTNRRSSHRTHHLGAGGRGGGDRAGGHRRARDGGQVSPGRV